MSNWCRWAGPALALVLVGCGGSDNNRGDVDVDARITELAAQQGLSGDPTSGRSLPDIADPMPQLGMRLFFSKSLGGDFDSACVTCHHPALGGGDDLSLPIGVGAVDPDHIGPGRAHVSGEATVPRNAPTTFNIALWDAVLFHDGRTESLGKTPLLHGADGGGIRTPDVPHGTADANAGENLSVAQARFPVTSAEEMRGHVFEAGNGNQAVRDHLADRLADRNAAAGELGGEHDWLSAFQEGFQSQQNADTLITYANVARALSAYQRSQVFTDTPWEAYLNGDTEALSPAAKRGAVLFFSEVSEGGAGCAGCHSGDFFTDEQFHVLAMPQLGPGKGDGDTQDNDFGRFRETGVASDRFAFRTPTLINVAHTEPYGHAGSHQTLEGVIRHHLDPFGSVDAYFANEDWCHRLPQFAGTVCDGLFPNAEANTRQALVSLEDRMMAGESALMPADLSDGEVADLVAFMEALSDPCVADPACLAPWVPAPEDAPDDHQLNAALP